MASPTAEETAAANSPNTSFGACSSTTKTSRTDFAGPGLGHLNRLRKTLPIVDSTTSKPAASCIGGAKHRRRHAAAKCRLRLEFLKRFVIQPSRAPA